jgi:hypothetical protein
MGSTLVVNSRCGLQKYRHQQLCLLPTAHCLLPTAHCLLPIAPCLLPAYSLIPTTYFFTPVYE